MYSNANSFDRRVCQTALSYKAVIIFYVKEEYNRSQFFKLQALIPDRSVV